MPRFNKFGLPDLVATCTPMMLCACTNFSLNFAQTRRPLLTFTVVNAKTISYRRCVGYLEHLKFRFIVGLLATGTFIVVSDLCNGLRNGWKNA